MVDLSDNEVGGLSLGSNEETKAKGDLDDNEPDEWAGISPNDGDVVSTNDQETDQIKGVVGVDSK